MEQASREVLLMVENLTKTYITSRGRIDAIKDVSFKVYKSELVSVIGPSGCGKSTILSMLGGINRPTSGKILLEGEQLTGPSPEIGIVFQQYAAFPWMTVEQNIGIRAAYAGIKQGQTSGYRRKIR